MAWMTTRYVSMDGKDYAAGEPIKFDEFNDHAREQLLALDPPAITWTGDDKPDVKPA